MARLYLGAGLFVCLWGRIGCKFVDGVDLSVHDLQVAAQGLDREGDVAVGDEHEKLLTAPKQFFSRYSVLHFFSGGVGTGLPDRECCGRTRCNGRKDQNNRAGQGGGDNSQ